MSALYTGVSTPGCLCIHFPYRSTSQTLLSARAIWRLLGSTPKFLIQCVGLAPENLPHYNPSVSCHFSSHFAVAIFTFSPLTHFYLLAPCRHSSLQPSHCVILTLRNSGPSRFSVPKFLLISDMNLKGILDF